MDNDVSPACAGCGTTCEAAWSGAYARYLCTSCRETYTIWELKFDKSGWSDSVAHARKIGVPGSNDFEVRRR